MRFTEDAFRGQVVLSSDGLVVGEIERLIIDPAEWRVRALVVRLRKSVAEHIGVPRSLFRAAQLEIPTDLVQSSGDAVILSVTVDALRPAPPGPREPPAAESAAELPSAEPAEPASR